MSTEFVSPEERTLRSPLHPAMERQTQSQRLAQAVERSAFALGRQQHPDGYWCGELTADSTLESDYILLQLWLHPASAESPGWQPPSPISARFIW